MLSMQRQALQVPQVLGSFPHAEHLRQGSPAPAEPMGHHTTYQKIYETAAHSNEHDCPSSWQEAVGTFCDTGITISPHEMHRECPSLFHESSALVAIPRPSNYLQDEYAFASELFSESSTSARDSSPCISLPPQPAVMRHPLRVLAEAVPGLVFDASTGLLDGRFDQLAAAAAMSSPDHDMSIPEIVQWMERYGERKLSEFGLSIRDGLLDGAHNVLVFAVLLSAPSQQMKLKDIYAAIKKNTTKRQAKNSNGWQNGVRHNLSMNDAFVKGCRDAVEDDDYDKRDHWWHIADEALESGVRPTTRYRNVIQSHALQQDDSSSDDDNDDAGVEEVDDDNDEADYRPTRNKRSSPRTKYATRSGRKAPRRSSFVKRYSKRQKAGLKADKASGKHIRQKLQLDARRAQSLGSDSFARSESPSPNIGNDSGYGSFNDDSSVRARSDTPLALGPPHPHSIKGRDSRGIRNLPFQRAATAEPFNGSYSDHDWRAKSATTNGHNVAVMLMNRRQAKPLPRNARAMTAPITHQSFGVAMPHTNLLTAMPSSHITQVLANKSCSTNNSLNHDYKDSFLLNNIDPRLMLHSREATPFTYFDDAMNDTDIYQNQSPALSSMSPSSATTGSSPLHRSCSADTGMDYTFVPQQGYYSPYYENYYHFDDLMLADSASSMTGLAIHEQDTMNMFMNFE